MAAADLDPLQAYDAVMRFAAKRGPAALHLALHAAMPQVLRPELLHQIRLNFVPEAVADLAVEADVLFAPFCEELGNGYYRFDPAARLLLLQELDPTYREKPRMRSERLASFLAAYVEHERLGETAGLDPLYHDYLEVEGWVALGFLDPDAAAEQLARAVERQLSSEHVAARVRVGGVAGALSIPLVRHRHVLSYAQGVEALHQGDMEGGRDLLERAGDEELRVGSVTLPSPAATLEARFPAAVEKSRPAPERPAMAKAPQAEDQHPRLRNVVISCLAADLREAERLVQDFVEDDRIGAVEILPPGSTGLDHIPRILGNATVVIVVIGDHWPGNRGVLRSVLPARGSEQVQETLASAIVRGIPIVPVLVDNMAMPDADTLPNSIKSVTRMQAVALRKESWDRDRERLVHALQAAEAPLSPASASTVSSTRDGIFLCYRRSEADIVRRMSDTLQQRFGETSVFMDVGDIPLGVDFREVIEAAVRRCRVMLVVIGPDWEHARGKKTTRLGEPDDFVRLEITTALAHGALVVPVMVERESLPARSALPAPLRPLLSRQAITLRKGRSFDRDMAPLMNAIARALESQASTDSEVSEATSAHDQEHDAGRQPSDTHTVLFVGHTIDRPDRTSPRFPPAFEPLARDAIQRALANMLKVHGRVVGVASASDGGDIIFHEECLEMGIPTTIYLPLPPDQFSKKFLSPAGDQWIRRFDGLRRRVHFRVVDIDAQSSQLPTESIEPAYRFDPWYANGVAMVAAATANGASNASVLALWNTEWGGPGGPSDLVERARGIGVAVIVLDTRRIFGAGPTAS